MAKEASTQLMLSAGSFMSRSGCALSQAWLSVSEAQRASYEAEARADGFADFEITERTPAGEVVAAAQRSVYFPVYYVEPYSGNEAALGFDLGSSQTRLQALNSATDTGDATTTAQITLVQETSTQSGFLFFVPIFAAGLPFETLEERQENLAGFALAVFRVGDMLEADLARLDTTGIDIQLIASTNPADPGVLYSQTSGEQPATPDWATDLAVADRTWTLAISSHSDLTGFSSWLPWAVLVVGLLATGLLSRFLLAIRGHADDVEKRVAERTAQLDDANRELTHSNQELEDFTYVVSHDLKEPLRGIEAFSAFLVEDYSEQLDGEGRRYISVVRESAVRMKSLIEDLLDLSRIGRVGANYSTVAVEPLIGEVTDDLQFSIEEKHVNLRIAPDLPDIVCDRARRRDSGRTGAIF